MGDGLEINLLQFNLFTAMKRKAEEYGEDVLTVTPLGAGNEVGRSCILLKFKGKTVMLDCGIHPAYSGLAALPFFDEIDPASVDILLISHFHLDHAASLPYFMEKTKFRGRVFMTHPTKAIYKWLLSDFVKISNIGVDDMLYDEKDLLRSYERIEAIDYHQEVEVDGIKFTSYNAGHVLGAAMFNIEIAGVKVFYTGDYSREEDRHLMAAERPAGLIPDVMICESTYGVQSIEPRISREARFTSLVSDTVKRGGRCLIPAFALGRAQELLLILDEFWQAHPELHSVPIYYASALAKKCMAVYQTYVNMMNERIRKQFSHSNPFVFKHISNLRGVDQFDDSGPCVMMASPAMLQSGLSRDLFERWCSDKKNSVIIPGYVVEGTLAKEILGEPDEIKSMDGKSLPLRMKVEYISFSAHVDYTQNAAFIDEMKPVHLVLVHGEGNEMNRLRLALIDKYHEKQETLKIHTPKNCETVELHFTGEKMAKTIGKLAVSKPKAMDCVQGILVGKDFQYNILSAEDLPEFTELKETNIKQRLCLAYHGPFELVKYHLSQMFGKLKDISKETISGKEEGVRIFDSVDLKKSGKDEISIEWNGNTTDDALADSIVSTILQIESHPASVKMTVHNHNHDHSRADITQEEQEKFVTEFLYQYFTEEDSNSNFVKNRGDGTLDIHFENTVANINPYTMVILPRSDIFKRFRN